VTDLFKTLSGGIAKFVLAWILPSALTVGLFVWLVLPSVVSTRWGHALIGQMPKGVEAAAVFTLVVLALAVVIALSDLQIYRLLEGYTLPAAWSRKLRARRVKEWHRLQILSGLEVQGSAAQGLGLERRMLYPDAADDVQATRLGNALRAMEGYGESRFGLDTQTLWYELMAASNGRVRSDSEDTRSSVDFFVSLVAHLTLLSTVSLLLSPFTASFTSLIVGTVTAFGAVAAYHGAVANMLEWRYVVQALVNTSRVELAQSLGYKLPSTHADERRLWQSFSGLVVYGPHPHYTDKLDLARDT
jgi:hypothetical protein